jgi:hypothetical protein
MSANHQQITSKSPAIRSPCHTRCVGVEHR